jgi:hypothetical protein
MPTPVQAVSKPCMEPRGVKKDRVLGELVFPGTALLGMLAFANLIGTRSAGCVISGVGDAQGTLRSPVRSQKYVHWDFERPGTSGCYAPR